MLYAYFGEDISKSQQKAKTLVTSLRTKKPDASYIEFNADSWNASHLEGHLGGQGLFSNKYIVFLDRVTENTEAKEQISEFFGPMKESENIFIILEGKLNAELKKGIMKYAEKFLESEIVLSAAKVKPEFNIFALADAVGMRNGGRAWNIFRQAMDSGMEAEGVAGTLFWQAKSMLLAKDAKTAGETGLNPFVFSKSKKYAENYSKEELIKMNKEIVTIYHEGHRGQENIELALENLVLNCGK